MLKRRQCAREFARPALAKMCGQVKNVMTKTVNVFTDLQSTCDFVFWYLFYLNAPMKNMSYDLCTPQAFLGFKTFSW